ncbi:MAG: DUF3472 domain-containing protein [Sphingobacterium sp.]
MEFKNLLNQILLVIVLGFISFTSCSQDLQSASPKDEESLDTVYTLPLAGNAFLSSGSGTFSERITNNGLTNWDNENTVTSTYIRVNKDGKLNLGLKAKVLPSGNTSQVQISINGERRTVELSGADLKEYPIGEFDVQAGYIKIDLQGVHKSGGYFADVERYSVTGTAINEGVIYSNDPEYYYWARRGPSCHLGYTIPTTEDVSYYYSEVEVPEGSDPIGSYFMANGFSEGYFGFQVNSESERRILFSVWSPYSTDDPNSIPEDEKIILNKKGSGVYTGEFGNEGSGGQSYLKYNWKAGNTYKFLLKGQPDGNGKTDFTAWFYAPDEDNWKLIASFKRPKTDKYLTGFHSFLENFNPEKGALSRTANYKNQWVITSNGQWKKIAEANFTVDNTYQANQRIDALGGSNQTGFFLKNGGFFSEIVAPNTKFNFENTAAAPNIDFENLPL